MVQHPKLNIDTLVINGRKHEWPNQQIAFEQVVALAYPNPPTGTDIQYEVTFYRRGNRQDKGTLEVRKHVKVRRSLRAFCCAL